MNPIVAVLLGWVFAGEKLTGSILLSMALAILAIWLVNQGSRRASVRAPKDGVMIESS